MNLSLRKLKIFFDFSTEVNWDHYDLLPLLLLFSFYPRITKLIEDSLPKGVWGFSVESVNEIILTRSCFYFAATKLEHLSGS